MIRYRLQGAWRSRWRQTKMEFENLNENIKMSNETEGDRGRQRERALAPRNREHHEVAIAHLQQDYSNCKYLPPISDC